MFIPLVNSVFVATSVKNMKSIPLGNCFSCETTENLKRASVLLQVKIFLTSLLLALHRLISYECAAG